MPLLVLSCMPSVIGGTIGTVFKLWPSLRSPSWVSHGVPLELNFFLIGAPLLMVAAVLAIWMSREGSHSRSVTRAAWMVLALSIALFAIGWPWYE